DVSLPLRKSRARLGVRMAPRYSGPHGAADRGADAPDSILRAALRRGHRRRGAVDRGAARDQCLGAAGRHRAAAAQHRAAGPRPLASGSTSPLPSFAGARSPPSSEVTTDGSAVVRPTAKLCARLTQGEVKRMTRMITAVTALASLAWLSTPAMAQQPMSECDKWVAKINVEVGTSADEASNNARTKVDEIAKLCKNGKTADAEKIAKETMATLGIKP